MRPMEKYLIQKFACLHECSVSQFKILDSNNKWSQLYFLEAFYIKTLNLKLTMPLKPLRNCSILNSSGFEHF